MTDLPDILGLCPPRFGAVKDAFAANFTEALKVIESAAPDVILLDINMPVLNGWEFLEELIPQLDKFPNDLPVFMLSSTIDQADFDKAKTYSIVKGFYSKPLTKENLSEIESILGV